MRRLLLVSALSAGMFAMACSNGDSTIMSPTSSSSDASTTGAPGQAIEKYYTVGRVVQSIKKPFHAQIGRASCRERV